MEVTVTMAEPISQQFVIGKVIPLPCGALMMVSEAKQGRFRLMQLASEKMRDDGRGALRDFARLESADNPYKSAEPRMKERLVTGAARRIIRIVRTIRANGEHATEEKSHP